MMRQNRCMMEFDTGPISAWVAISFLSDPRTPRDTRLVDKLHETHEINDRMRHQYWP
jgi:hypothetical protein